MSKFVAPWPPSPPRTSLLYSSKDLLAEYAAQLTAMNAALLGHLEGTPTVADFTASPTPLNPGAGTHGHDHSGGEFGRAFFRPLAVFGFQDFQEQSANWSASKNPTTLTLTGVVASAADDIGPEWTGRNTARIPGCDPLNGAYLHLAVQGTCRVIATSGLSGGDVLTIRIRNRHPDINSEIALVVTGTTTGEKRFASSADLRLAVVPGVFNPIDIGYHIDVDGTAGTRSIELECYDLELGVYDTSV